MESKIKTPTFEKLYYGLILFVCFGLTSYFLFQTNTMESDLGGRKERLQVVCFIFIILGIYSVFKIYENSKSKFILSNKDNAEKKVIIENLADEKYFSVISNSKAEYLILGYQKYWFGLDYEIHFVIEDNYVEFNAFCNRLGILDYGTRRRIMKIVENKICTSL